MLLKGEQLGFRYGKGPWLFRKLDIAIESGEVVGLAGPSGCGKTTLARILAGYQSPGEGSVGIDGVPLPKSGYNPVQLIWQHPEKAVNPRWRMRDTLHEGWQPDQAMLQALGIQTEWLGRWPNELSGGELQRFCVARALGKQTRFLIADEMTTMLDAITQAQIWNAVLEYSRQQKIGMLVVSHEASLLQRICNRVIPFEVALKNEDRH